MRYKVKVPLIIQAEYEVEASSSVAVGNKLRLIGAHRLCHMLVDDGHDPYADGVFQYLGGVSEGIDGMEIAEMGNGHGQSEASIRAAAPAGANDYSVLVCLMGIEMAYQQGAGGEVVGHIPEQDCFPKEVFKDMLIEANNRGLEDNGFRLRERENKSENKE